MNEIDNNIRRRYNIIGNSPELWRAIDRALRVAPTEKSVLVYGENGTGKDVFSKIIHDNSLHKNGKLIAVNCGAIPEGTIDSELFGHVKGSFTGAINDHKGYFEEADKGTIFLDEVGELPLGTQSRLLRVLESGTFMKVGSSNEQKTNVRVIAATNRDLEKAKREGSFRDDLFYRLNQAPITLPPLRDRGEEDIVNLTRYFMREFVHRYKTPEAEITPEGFKELAAYRWPGNIRELKNMVELIALEQAGKTVDASVVRTYLPMNGNEYALTTVSDSQFDYSHDREYLMSLVRTVHRLETEVEALKRAMAGGGQVPVQRMRYNTSIEQLRRDSQSLLPLNRATDATPTANPQVDLTAGDAQDLGHVDEVKVSEVVPETPLTLEQTQEVNIKQSLARNGGNRKATAAELGISERTLYRKIKLYGLGKDGSKWIPDAK